MNHRPYDAFILISYGGPQGPDDVMPFLENVLRGRPVPRQRMLEVAQHYHHFDGVSPINQANRDLIDALRKEFDRHAMNLPIYWGNRNWAPYLTDTVKQMKADGVKRAIGFVTSAFSSYSGCRQYREDIRRAIDASEPNAPAIDKIRSFFNHPGFVQAMAQRVKEAMQTVPGARLIFTAHSVPMSMARTSAYVDQLKESCRLVAGELGDMAWELVYQSRSGPPGQPWLEPDVCDYLRDMAAGGDTGPIVLAPIGFIADHMEVVYDLDTEARQVCDEKGITMVRAGTVGVHPRFVAMIRELVQERQGGTSVRLAMGDLPACPDVCPADCCPAPAPPPRAGAGGTR